MRIEVRQATTDEWQTVRQTRLAALLDAPYAFGSSYEREKDFDEATWRLRLSNPDGPTFIAFDGDEPIGIDGVFTAEGVYTLVAMWVAPRARRSGVGEALTREVLGWARARAAKKVLLGVADGNDTARRLYERMGFKPTGRSEPLRSDPSRLVIEMVREL